MLFTHLADVLCMPFPIAYHELQLQLILHINDILICVSVVLNSLWFVHENRTGVICKTDRN